jgi:hypothetical protein
VGALGTWTGLSSECSLYVSGRVITPAGKDREEIHDTEETLPRLLQAVMT